MIKNNAAKNNTVKNNHVWNQKVFMNNMKNIREIVRQLEKEKNSK